MHTCVLVADDRDIYDALDRFTNYDHEAPKPDSRWDFFNALQRPAIAPWFQSMRLVSRVAWV